MNAIRDLSSKDLYLNIMLQRRVENKYISDNHIHDDLGYFAPLDESILTSSHLTEKQFLARQAAEVPALFHNTKWLHTRHMLIANHDLNQTGNLDSIIYSKSALSSDDVSLFQKNLARNNGLVIIPIAHQNRHWQVLAVDQTNHRVYEFDSMCPKIGKHGNMLDAAYHARLQKLLGIKDYKTSGYQVIRNQSRYQFDGHNCGAFATAFSHFLATNRDPLVTPSINMDECFQRYIAESTFSNPSNLASQPQLAGRLLRGIYLPQLFSKNMADILEKYELQPNFRKTHGAPKLITFNEESTSRETKNSPSTVTSDLSILSGIGLLFGSIFNQSASSLLLKILLSITATAGISYLFNRHFLSSKNQIRVITGMIFLVTLPLIFMCSPNWYFTATLASTLGLASLLIVGISAFRFWNSKPAVTNTNQPAAPVTSSQLAPRASTPETPETPVHEQLKAQLGALPDPESDNKNTEEPTIA